MVAVARAACIPLSSCSHGWAMSCRLLCISSSTAHGRLRDWQGANTVHRQQPSGGTPAPVQAVTGGLTCQGHLRNRNMPNPKFWQAGSTQAAQTACCTAVDKVSGHRQPHRWQAICNGYAGTCILALQKTGAHLCCLLHQLSTSEGGPGRPVAVPLPACPSRRMPPEVWGPLRDCAWACTKEQGMCLFYRGPAQHSLRLMALTVALMHPAARAATSRAPIWAPT